MSMSWCEPSASYSSARSLRTSAMPVIDPSRSIGTSTATTPLPNAAWRSASTRSKSARSLFSLLTKIMRGTPAAAARFQRSSVPTSTPSTALTTTIARSATPSAASTSPAKSA
jgi:hypothetical protein